MRIVFPLALAVLTAACATPREASTPAAPVTVGILAFNDFHGNLEEPVQPVSLPDALGGTRQVKAGSAARLASAIAGLRGKYAHSATVSAGDLISASPLVSSLFLDEPTIAVMNRVGLNFNAVGNHEFDRGRAELLRMQNGGCEQHTLRRPCTLEPFAGARFGFLAASTFAEDGRTLLPATGMRRFGTGKATVTVGFVGLTLRDTPTLVPPAGVEGLRFGDEAEAINAAALKLRTEGADAVVALIHEGGTPASGSDPNGCEGLAGPILSILEKLDPGVDVVVSGHTHHAYICDKIAETSSAPLLLTSAGSFGRMITEIGLVIDPVAKRVIARTAKNHIVDAASYAPDPAIAAYVARYAEAVRPTAARPIGKLSGPARRSEDGMGGTLGNLVADAQLAATRRAGAQIAFTNPFGLRAPIEPAPDGTVTFAQIYAAQPFDNILITRSLTGAQLKALLEQGLDVEGPFQTLAPSAGFAYSYDLERAPGDRIAAMRLDGVPIRADGTYRVTVGSFLAGGGDGFSVFRQGTERTISGGDLDALEAWIAGASPRTVAGEERLARVSAPVR